MSPQSDPPADPYAQLDAAYLLGALSPEERTRYEAHLEGCPTCRVALDRLAPVLPFLAASDETAVDAAEPLAVPDTVLPQLLAAAGRVSRRRRALTSALGVLAVACVAAIVFLTTGALGARPAPGRPMTALASTPVTAEVRLQATPWGTRIDLTCRYASVRSAGVGYSYALSVLGTDGRRHELGTWQLNPGAQVSFTAGTALSLAQISSIDVTDPYGTRVLTLST